MAMTVTSIPACNLTSLWKSLHNPLELQHQHLLQR